MADRQTLNSFYWLCKSWGTNIKQSNNVRKLIHGIDAGQLYPFLMNLKVPTRLYTKLEFNSKTKKNLEDLFRAAGNGFIPELSATM